MASSLDDIAVVVGHDAARVRDTLTEFPGEIVTNPAHESGQATSVRAGIEWIRKLDK